MKIEKSIQLSTKSFEKLLQDGESMDFRLDQETWKNLETGDFIEFWEDRTGWQTEPEENAQKVLVQIENIYRAPTFKELFDLIEKEHTHLKYSDKSLSSLRRWWSKEKEEKEGVLALHVTVQK